ncbi:MAG: trypsin-like serine protease, partial [Pseudomonadota bacterium]
PGGPTFSEPADDPAPGQNAPAPPDPTDSDTGSTAPSAPNTSAPDLAGGTGTAPPPANAGTPPPPAPEPQVIPASIPSLGAINAARCGLPEGAAPTPTVSVQAQALTGPQPESLLTVQAVGAVTVQSLTAFPGIVKMEPRRFEGNAIASGHCAATRIAERWFLTAAHCVDDEYDEIRFIAGTPNLRDLGSARMFKADAAICHSGYAGRETNFINDLALIRVSEDALPALTEVPIAEFGITDRPLGDYHYATADMAGWGMTGFNQPLSPLLLSAELNIVSASPSVIVISSREGAGPCIGDSGGPLYVTEADGQRTVVGVLSVVEQLSGQNLCEGDYRGRYTNITGYREWISDIMSQCAFQPDLCTVPASAPAASDLPISGEPSEDAIDPTP